MKHINLKKIIAISMLTLGLIAGGSGNGLAHSQDLPLEGDHGRIAAILQTPDDVEAYPLVILMHDLASRMDDDVIRPLANALESKGIASLRFDFNGHGMSQGYFEGMTVPDEIEDAKKVYLYAAKLPNITSISLAGHGQGGVVASMTAGILGTENIKSLVLMAPAAVLRDDALRGIGYYSFYDPNDVPETVSIHDDLFLSRDYILTAQTLPIYETSVKYQGPVFIIHGTKDDVVPYTYGERYQRIYSQGQLLLIPGGNHYFTNDINAACQAVAEYFVAQLKK